MGLTLNKSIGAFSLAVLGPLLVCADASAQTLYGTSYSGNDGASTLNSISTATGTAAPIGAIGFERCGALDANSAGVLYATCERSDGSNTPVLVTIDPDSGVGTEVGPTGISGAVGDISFRGSDDVLFALDVTNDPDHSLYTLDTNTGSATLVGHTGLAFAGGNAVTFDLTGVLYHSQFTAGPGPNLNTLDPATGQPTFINQITPATGRFSAMDAEPGTGEIYAILNDGSGGTPVSLATIDPQGPVSSVVGPTSNGMDGIAFVLESTVARATFEVVKDFSDDNPMEVEVTLNCFTGLPLTQSQSISEEQNVVFVVQDFDNGELDCEVTEEDVDGYTASYQRGATVSAIHCEYNNVGFGASALCTITNTPDPVDVTVHKDWVVDGNGGELLDSGYKLTLYCDGEIVDGYQNYSGDWKKTLHEGDSGISDATFHASVVPHWDGGTDCWVDESVYDSSVEVDNGCDGLQAFIGEGDACTVTNTVFYEGIPSLDRNGMALLVLLMLGLGFVGMRRWG